MATRRHLLFGLPLLAGCRSSRQKRIGVIPKATWHLFFVSVHAGAQQAGRDLGVEVIWNGPNDETDYTRQIQIVDAMIARQVDALAISATDERALVAPLERAQRAGIPVSVFDSAVNFEDYVSFVATDNSGAGGLGARALAGLISSRGKVAVVMQQPGGASTGQRERAFDETMGKEFPGVQIVARQFAMGDRARARAAAENILTAHPDLAGLFSSSEAGTIGSIQAIRSRNLSGKVKLVGFDSSGIHIEALRDGTLDATLVQDPFRIGYEAVKSLSEKLNGRSPSKRLDLPARVIMKADLEKPDVKALLFPEWLKEKQ
jgi:ribose transport system substrate-binding protein